MTERVERVLAIDVDSEVVRGILLSNGTPAVAGGYAQLPYDRAHGAADNAARIAAALDGDTTLPVVVTCDTSLSAGVADDVVTAISGGGFTTVSVAVRAQAVHRSNPGGGTAESLVDAEIPAGLLTSHAGLTLTDLAAVVGAGLEALGLGAPLESSSDEPVAVWSPDAEAPPAPDADPFTSAPKTAAAAAVGGAVTAAAVGGFHGRRRPHDWRAWNH